MNSSRILLSLVAAAFPLLAAAQTIVDITPPNGQDVVPRGVRAGKVVGSYLDGVDGRRKGFMYSQATGNVSFEVPASIGAAGTFATGSDQFGRISGYYNTDNFRIRGFVRAANGTFQTFDADYPQPESTYTYASNGLGSIVGEYRRLGDNYIARSFVRTPLGFILHVKPPSSGYTVATDINAAGSISGFWGEDFGTELFGFIRSPLGYYTSYASPPGCAIVDFFVFINTRGDVASSCGTPTGDVSGYIRTRSGAVTRIDYPGSSTTFVQGIADNGDVSGYYYLPTTGLHGYVRKSNGTWISFDVPNADPGNTFVSRADEQGNIVGTYYAQGGTKSGAYIRYASH